MIELIESSNCVIFQEFEIQQKNITFDQNHIIAYIQQRLDYFLSLVSYKNQEKMLIYVCLVSDHSPISFNLRKLQIIAK